MPHAQYEDCPEILRNYLFYLETIKGRSPRTVNGYYIDIRTFLRFWKVHRNLVDASIPIEEITIHDITGDDLKSITLSDVYEFLHYAMNGRDNMSSTRARKVSSLRGFFKYLTNNLNLLSENPLKNLEVPSIKKSLPKYLTLEQSLELLRTAENSEFKERDYCIITLFLNCGMRLSELVGLNLSDIGDQTLRLLGKGNKERIVYLNDACTAALKDYLLWRNSRENIKDKKALFITSRGTRISTRWVEKIIEKALAAAGLGGMGLSVHKLRHTAATMMYQHGHVDIRVLKEILGHANLGTTEIYTHVSNEQMQSAAEKSPLSKVRQKPVEKDDSNDNKE